MWLERIVGVTDKGTVPSISLSATTAFAIQVYCAAPEMIS
jgi:hypothetical protein